MKSVSLFLGLSFVFFIVGCATVSPLRDRGKELYGGNEPNSVPNKKESRQEVESAVGEVADAIIKRNVREKYCPVCGKHYSGHLQICPKCKVPLEEVEK